jgi:murein DD-endopeptidase MepM/ murein hydrolase activator NlpD
MNKTAAVPLLHYEKQKLKNRINNILGGKKMLNKRRFIKSLFSVLVIGVLILPMAGTRLFAQESIDADNESQSGSVEFKLPFGDLYWHGRITFRFREDRHPFTGKMFFHKGIDIPLEIGTPIFASANGIIIETENDFKENEGPGKYVRIQHNNGFITEYRKLNEIITTPGQLVKAGEVIGYSGNTGLSTGPHLHFSIYKDGEPVNPEDYIIFN